MPLPRRLARTFGRTPGAVGRARHLMGACLDAWRVGDEDRLALLLLVDELVANAVRHGMGSIQLYVNASDTVVRIEVYDHGGGEPHVRSPQRSGPQIGGWGLRLVDRLADTWGATVRRHRTVVWAQRAIQGATVGTPPAMPLS